MLKPWRGLPASILASSKIKAGVSRVCKFTCWFPKEYLERSSCAENLIPAQAFGQLVFKSTLLNNFTAAHHHAVARNDRGQFHGIVKEAGIGAGTHFDNALTREIKRLADV